MPKKVKKVKKDVKQRATNIININLDGKTKRKRRQTKKVSSDVKGVKTLKYDTDYLKKNSQGLISGYTPPSLFNPLRPAYNVITQAAPKSNDWEDALKKLIEMQTNQFKQAIVTPGKTPDVTSVAVPTPKAAPTPKPSSSSSSTPGYTIRLPPTSSKQSILQSVKKADLVKPSSRVVSDVDSSDYANPFDAYQKSISNAFITPDSFYETDVEDAINKQMPPVIDESKAASASSSSDTILETRKRNVDQAVNQLVDNVMMDSFQEVQAEEQKRLIDKSKQQLDVPPAQDNPGNEVVKVVEQAKSKPFLMDNDKPKNRLWNTGLKYSYISYPMIPKPGQDGETFIYQVALKQDGSIWLSKDGENWRTETQTLRSPASQQPFNQWKSQNADSLVFPEEQKVEVKKGKGRPAKSGI